MADSPVYLTIQFGARRRYAVPALIAREKMGGHLVTDITGDHDLGKVISTLVPKPLRPGAIQKMSQRKVPSELLDRTTTFPSVALKHHLKMRKCHSQIEMHNERKRFCCEMSQKMMNAKLPEFTHVYSAWGEGIDFLEAQKKEGKTILIEVLVSPETYQIVWDLRKNYPDFPNPYSQEYVDAERAYWDRVLNIGDYFIVPSEFVAKTCRVEDPEKIIKVPYCTPEGWNKVESKPKQGRILFVGSADIRKGIHILGQAAQSDDCKDFQFYVAGGVVDQVKQHAMTKKLKFLGRVPRTEIQNHFASADVFVLPSYAEGSAEVIYEALAIGLPVVTTFESGSVVRDDVEGLIIPKDDPEALAKAIAKIVNDRELRNTMSENARKRAEEFSWDIYGKRLAYALRNFETPNF